LIKRGWTWTIGLRAPSWFWFYSAQDYIPTFSRWSEVGEHLSLAGEGLHSAYEVIAHELIQAGRRL